MQLDKDLSDHKVWSSAKSQVFYQSHRNRPKDLYPSEKFFLPEILTKVSSCLDIRCAAGGFSNIMKYFNPSLKYTGIDFIAEFIELARKTYPDSSFYVGDAAKLPFEHNSFELVFSTGILHLIPHYKQIVESAYYICSTYLLCDFQLTEGPEVIGEMNADFGSKDTNKNLLPYIVVNIDDLITFLSSLNPRPKSIRAKGYSHSPSYMTRITLDEVIMAFFLIEKGNFTTNQTLVDLNFSCKKD